MSDRTVIITGASSGIGKALALLLARNADRLLLIARRQHLLEQVAEECRLAGARAVDTVAADVGTSSGINAIERAAQGADGKLALVNNAGFAKFAPASSLSSADLEAIIRSNLIGLIETTRVVLPLMLAAGSGQIVNVLSVAAVWTFPNSSAYCAAKAGALAYTRCLSQEVRSQGVRVSSILPGATDTEIWSSGDWKPPAEDMLSAREVAVAIQQILNLPEGQVIDELMLTPPKGRV